MNPTESTESSGEKLVVVSVGRHSRLGDILEYALADTAFETVDSDAFLRGSWINRKLLFTISTEETSDCTPLQTLTAALHRKESFLEGCVCAAVLDGAQGGLAHLGALSLLLAANRSGAIVLSRPLIECDKDLRFFSGGKESPFERVRVQTRLLIERLQAAESNEPEAPNLRLLTTLESGAAHDWRALLSRIAGQRGGELIDIEEPYVSALLCENTQGLPDERTLSLFQEGGRLRILLASPAMGSELYIACLIERACLTGNYALAPRAVLVFEGMSAVEVPASKRETERVKAMLTR